ncbi:hypothetical protein DFH94DRAFT_686393 [Russula ochroleuca]|uniref:methylisocitrate lyase n=1 Tax=Russula ochroleuca TaxID=152965 RepID=A0A9P5JVB8_9AGAM|nr:hypothetical protein DFH94DRAFT_686393 [Russula ochroleuca]
MATLVGFGCEAFFYVSTPTKWFHFFWTALLSTKNHQQHFSTFSIDTVEGYCTTVVRAARSSPVNRSVASAGYADLLWMEAKAILVETREFPEGTDRAQPDQWPAYNLNLGFDGDAADLGEKGMREFVRQFVTLSDVPSLWLALKRVHLGPVCDGIRDRDMMNEGVGPVGGAYPTKLREVGTDMLTPCTVFLSWRRTVVKLATAATG